MPAIELATRIDAPRERVFDLERRVDVHERTMADHGERAVDGVTEGVLDHGDRVTWRARHFGVPLTLTVEITALDRPTHFRDELVSGPFAALVHDHRFEERDGGTVMHDRFRYESPLGPLGRLADAVYLEGYLRDLLVERNRVLKRIAETES